MDVFAIFQLVGFDRRQACLHPAALKSCEKHLIGRCEQFNIRDFCRYKENTAENTCRIFKVFDAITAKISMLNQYGFGSRLPMDYERLKNSGTVLTKEYFEKRLEKIREIHLSERKFYQKITDIYATALDYDPSAKAIQRFFAAVQNKLHYSVHGQTASEVIYNRADAQKENMGLTSWDGAPKGKIHKYDVTVAKNYLSENELHQLERIVSAYLDLAEVQAERHIPMTMADWEERLNGFLKVWDREVLQDSGKISAELAKMHALSEFEKYRFIQDRLYESDFDRFLTDDITDDK